MTFPNALSEFVFTRTYSRWNPELGRRETWTEAVDRVIRCFKKQTGDKITETEYQELRDAILNFEVMPSMRMLAMAGDAVKQNNICAYNCAYVAIDDLFAFPEILYILMAGTGAGFSIEHRYISQLPVVAPVFTSYSPFLLKRHHIVDDTTEGWAEALRIGLDAWFNGEDVEFDYSRIRAAGTPLKTKGGRASGPEPLKELLDFVRNIVLGAAGRQLTSLECLDIANKIATIVVVGGVRRSSEISLSDLSDTDIRDAKNGPIWETAPQRYMSNNSVAYDSKPERTAFDAEWKALAVSGTGERGIFSRRSARMGRPGRRKDADFGTNPCFVPGTMIQTRRGHFPIEQLVGKSVEIWNGAGWQRVDNFRVTAKNQPMLKITMHDGTVERVTPYHTVILDSGERVQAKDLRPGMKLAFSHAPMSYGTHHEAGAYLKGFLVGDGTYVSSSDIGSAVLSLYAPKYVCEHRLVASCAEVQPERVYTNGVVNPGFGEETQQHRKMMKGLGVRKDFVPWSQVYKRMLPRDIFSWDEASICSFIAGVMDADGTASDTKNGFLYQITSIHKPWLEDFQLLLRTIGVDSKLSLANKAGKTDFGDGYGEYETHESWRLTISQGGAIVLSSKVTFDRLTSFADKKLAYNLKPRRNRVVSVEPDGIEPLVYCCTVEGSHALGLTSGFIYGNCGEVILRSAEFCNLSEVVARKDDDEASLVRKVRLAAILGTIQATFTDFPYIRPIWKQNCEEERLLGVSVTGEMDCPAFRDDQYLMHRLRNVAFWTNREYASRLGINTSAAITLVKPSGTASLLVDASSGIHPRYAKHYIRRVRISATDPLCRLIRDAGVPLHPEVGEDAASARTWVAEFVVEAPSGAVTRNDLTALEQLEYWARVKQHWCEHNPSATIYVAPDEWDAVGQWVWERWNSIGGLSFLPKSDHVYQLAPYEEISEEEYHTRAAAFPEIDYSLLPFYELEDRTEGSREYACSGDKCELV